MAKFVLWKLLKDLFNILPLRQNCDFFKHDFCIRIYLCAKM